MKRLVVLAAVLMSLTVFSYADSNKKSKKEQCMYVYDFALMVKKLQLQGVTIQEILKQTGKEKDENFKKAVMGVFIIDGEPEKVAKNLLKSCMSDN